MCNMNDGMRTILQVTKCTDVPSQMFFAKGLSEFVSKCFKDVDAGEAAFGSKFTSEVHNLTVLLK